ncbi:EF-hand domain-containing protein [Pleomorphomonas oryzae]|uniref:EF-hand domain-containing protein n=1 Tax=Pleomorphomonas oryzae TaxID=261934 RepID=UPI00042A0A3C|nr:EF-hand domain-containing protein [Pleomorphomonas oryzae]
MRSSFRILIAGGLVAFSVLALAADRLADIAFTRLDANGDGQLDAAELKQARAQRFERLDVDGDGVVTAAEQAEASNRMIRKAETLEGAMAIRFEALDTDGDGKLMREEFVNTQGAGLAARMDKDGDGKVSKAEFLTGIEAARAIR